MALGYDRKLYILAFDHRGSFQKKMFGIQGAPDAEQTRTISDAKRLIFEGFRRAIEQGAPKDAAGILVDEQFGADVVREAEKESFVFAMPVEKSGQDEFDFEYGDDFGRHIEDFNPTFSKVLVRYNPEGDARMNERQTERLKRLSDWLHDNDRKFLFELLVPAEEQQLASVGGDADRYDKEVRPALMVTTIKDLQEAGVEADVWKIEGIDQRDDCQKISEQVRSGGRDNVVCVVLGRGANDDAVEHWLKTGAGVPGYIGFAIGRTIWWDELKGFLAGDVEREEAADRIAQKYRRFIDVYESA
ncbi:MAG: 2-deoxy-5-keto-D-gluconate 6-phosphate aldolase domain-containing protein [Actinomycetota bacterium]